PSGKTPPSRRFWKSTKWSGPSAFGPVAGRPFLSPADCAVGRSAPALASQHRQGPEHRGTQIVQPGRVWQRGHPAAAALSNRTKVDPVPGSKEASLVQREVAANAAGGIVKLGESFTRLYNPPCMAEPCCPPFAQGGLW